MNILFVCTGNTCRSPMAEGILLELDKEYKKSLKVTSAGTFGIDGGSISLNSLKALENIAIDYGHFKSSSLKRELLKDADLVLTMSNSHKSMIFSDYPEFRDKVFTLKEYVYESKEDILDPFGGSLNIYEATRDELRKILEDFIKMI